MEIGSKKDSGFSLNTNNGKKHHFDKQTGFSINAKESILTEEKIKKIEHDYETVVVHDFGDDYHLSEAERIEKNKNYEAFSKVRRCKRKYRKLPEFVKAYRLCLDCLDIIASNNAVYPVDKFRKMVLSDVIEVIGLNFPKYVGKDKKSINWDYVTGVIMDRSVDPNILDKTKEHTFDIDDVDDLDEYRRKIFGDELYEKIFNSQLSELEVLQDPKFDVKPYDPKGQKSLVSVMPSIQMAVRDMKREMNRRSDITSYVYEIGQSDFEYIEGLDRKRGLDNFPKFEGNLMDKKDYNKYMLELQEFYQEQVKIPYYGKNKTPDEIRMIQLKDALENAGWNVRALYKYDKSSDKEKKKLKEDKKKEKRLKKKLIAIQKRRDKKKKMKKDKGNKDKEKSGI